MKGFSIIEAVIAAAIVAVGIAGIMSAYTAYVRAAGRSISSVQASLLAEEGIEAALYARDKSWSGTLGTYTENIPYFLAWSSGAWAVTTTPAEIDSTYYRTITFQSVYRGSNDQIVRSGGTLDPNTLLAMVSVSWRGANATSSVALSSYISNLFSN